MTEKHKQEAREIVVGVLVDSSIPKTITLQDALVSRIALALSSRDKEIREVLEGLIIRRYDDVPCWCDKGRAIPMGLNHEPACLAARALWERVQD